MTIEMKSPSWVITWTDDPKAADILGADDRPFYQPDDIERAIAKAVAAEREQWSATVAEREFLIRDLRKELNERRYGRSAAK